MKNMKELKDYFEGRGEVKGYSFKQIKSTEYGYIYKVTSSTNTHFEVFRKKINTLYNCVSYPSSKAFGKWAWTCGNLENAEYLLNQIKTKYKKNKGDV